MKEHITDSEMEELLRAHAHEARDIWLSSLPQRDEVPKHTFSRRFTRRMNRLLAQQRRTPRENRVVAFAQRAAVVALVMITASAGSVYAYRIGLIDTIVHSFQEYTELLYTSETNIENAEFPEVTLTYLPEDMEEYTDENLTDSSTMRFLRYRRSDGTLVELDQFLITEDSGTVYSIDTENADVERFTIEGEVALLSAKDNWVMITWTHNSVVYTIYTEELSVEETKKIALGVKEK